MKKYFTIVCIFFFACKTSTKLQNSDAGLKNKLSNTKPVLDTLDYVRSKILANKAKYVNKPFSVLLNDLEIPVKSYTFGFTSRNRYIVPNIIISFENPDEVHKKLFSSSLPVSLVIYWDYPLPMDSVTKIFSNGKGQWTEKDNNYFGGKILKDLDLIKK